MGYVDPCLSSGKAEKRSNRPFAVQQRHVDKDPQKTIRHVFVACSITDGYPRHAAGYASKGMAFAF